MTDLERKIIKGLIAKGYGLNPMDYVEDGQYAGYEDWDTIKVGNETYDIDFFSDGKEFIITAHPLFLKESGKYDRGYNDSFHLKVYQLQGVVA
jgi:hypothetical protein